ncbi:cache domain-containing sensor histidine kinase [Paenibacillus aceris]|uniref:Two-component system sensor histidine kinase YesM n=1 Tax=Paenibacillus aceris TaxID=869555 RepID=A0ABS4I762_9BACL|nr:sensor histidine kinase [Paenibacillus aceris]MBP1966749.1 two-component system sensor histidine kinase YesM [Paenibacillus aceris]NHW39376.1 sensor histidine kinase [Paenibacillus aceris]
MIKWFGYSLRSKLSVIMLVTTLIPLLFLGTFAFTISSNVTEGKAQQAGLDTLAQMDAKFRFILKDVENMSLFIIGQSEVQAYMNKPDESKKIAILGLMTNLVYSKDYISNITLYSKNPSAEAPLSTSTIYQTDIHEQIDIKEITDKTWTQLYHIENYLGERKVFSFIRPFRSYNSYQTLGWLSITLDEQVLSRIWSEPMLAEGHGQVALLNNRHEVMSATDKSWLARPFESLFPGVSANLRNKVSGEWTYGQGNTQHNILYYREPSIDWTIVGVIPSQLYRAQNRYILQLLGVAALLAILTNIVLTLFVIQKVTNPLRTLTRLLSKINPNEPLPQYPADSKDEIGRLAQSYNMLGTHIEALKKQLIQNETRKKEADMRALQAQINPHFLYNTLSSIHWIALLTEENRIAEMVGALSDFLRFSLNKGKEYCTVSQEIAHIRNYVLVQAIRFPDEFEVDFTIDARLNNTLMLKLLLQPLVENAMIHGIQKKEAKGTISIYAEQKGNLIGFKVMDDGIGMSEEQLAAVKQSLNPQDGQPPSDASYGMRNVHERLLLHYGPESGLIVESKLYAGTCVSFSIPILEESHENHDR